MGLSAPRCIGLVVLILALLACCVCFISPYWLAIPRLDMGLVSSCLRGNYTLSPNCEVKWDILGDFTPVWKMAAQAMFAFSLLLMLAAIPCACISVCCDLRMRTTLSRGAGSLLMMAGVLISISIIVWAVMVTKILEIKPTTNDISKGMFNWGFHLGIAGVILDLVAACIFLCSPDK